MTPPTTSRRLALPLLLLALPSAAAAAEVPLVRITGTGSAIGLIERVARAFEQSRPGRRVQVLPSVGSAVAAGALDVGLSGRDLQPDERQVPVRLVEFARTPFLFAAAPDVEARNLTAAEAARIYRGQVVHWPKGERIRLVLRPRSDADTAYLRTLAPEMAAAVDASQDRPGMLVATTNQECDQTIARTPGALGPSTLAQLRTEPRGLQPLAWEGVEPTLENLVAGRYKLSKPLYLVLPRAPSPVVRELMGFLASPAGRRLLEESGCQPLPLPALD